MMLHLPNEILDIILSYTNRLKTSLVCKLFYGILQNRLHIIHIHNDWIENKNKYIDFINKLPYLHTIKIYNIKNYFIDLSIITTFNIKKLVIDESDVMLPQDNVYLPKMKELELYNTHINAKGKHINKFISLMPNLQSLYVKELTTTSSPHYYGNLMIYSKLLYNNINKHLKELYLVNICCPKKRKSDFIYDNIAKIKSLELLLLNGNLNLIRNVKNPNTFVNMYNSLINLKWLSYEIYYRKDLDEEAGKYTKYISDLFHSLYVEELNIYKGNYAITSEFIKRCIKNKNIKSKLKKIFTYEKTYILN